MAVVSNGNAGNGDKYGSVNASTPQGPLVAFTALNKTVGYLIIMVNTSECWCDEAISSEQRIKEGKRASTKRPAVHFPPQQPNPGVAHQGQKQLVPQF